MIDKAAPAIFDPPFGSVYVAVNICAEPLPEDGVTETGDPVCESIVACEGAAAGDFEQRSRMREEAKDHSETRIRTTQPK
jgi:hypothetical protein